MDRVARRASTPTAARSRSRRRSSRTSPARVAPRCTDGAGVELPADGVRPDRVTRYGTPRQGADGPLTDDVMKCQLKPLRRDDYAGHASPTRSGRGSQQAFPSGVCDYTQAGRRPARRDPVAHLPGQAAAA